MRLRPASLAAGLVAALALSGTPTLRAQAPRADFSGSWALKDEKPGASEGEPPLEVIVNASELAIEDDGGTLRVTYPAGRKRIFFLDGQERTLDDGGGPAKVIAKRSGASVSVFSKWANGRALVENWELKASPRRLTVSGKATGRQSTRYERSYEVAPPKPTPTPTPTAAPEASPSASGPAPVTTPGARPECSVHPPKRTDRADLARMAKISLHDAETRATAAVAPKRPASIITSDVEVDERGCLVWPIDMRFAGEKGVWEVVIDAGNGNVLSSGVVTE
jgi:hypothetical protein